MGTTAGDVRRALRDRVEIALLDVRPEARFAGGHPLFAASFPLGRLEADVYSRLPRRSVPVVVYGEGPGDAAAAARRLSQLGYEQVSLLAGGLDGWTARGGELFCRLRADVLAGRGDRVVPDDELTIAAAPRIQFDESQPGCGGCQE